MKLSKIYSNKNELFEDIKFNEEFNVIFGDVENPKDNTKDSHNLGKTLLISVIDFMMLKKMNKHNFFMKYLDKFKMFEFFLEIELNSGKFLTIKRGVEDNSKISFKMHEERNQNFVNLDSSEWNHDKIAIDKSREILNTYLGLTSLGENWSYRTGITYFLRNQYDYQDVFQIGKFVNDNHVNWKPYLMKILGFDDNTVIKKYELDEKILEQKSDLAKLNLKLTYKELKEYDKLKGVIEIKEKEVNDYEKEIEKFNFFENEIDANEKLIEIERKIALLNNDLYNLDYQIKKINESLEKKVKFKINDIKTIFEESKIYFENQITKDYDNLLSFNKKVYSERKKYLKENLKKLESKRGNVIVEIRDKESIRSDLLNFIREEDSFKKFKNLQKNLIQKKSEIFTLKQQLLVLEQVSDYEEKIQLLESERDLIVKEMKLMVHKKNNPTYSKIRNSFNQIIKDIFGESALLSIIFNTNDNPEFEEGIAKDEKTWELTNEGEGTSWKKILCMAFDLAVLSAHSKDSFFRFVYHDGILEGLDNRKKNNLLKIIKSYCEKYKIQYILTSIKDDLPRDKDDELIYFEDKEVIKTLNDSGNEGRLFKMNKF